MKEWWWWRRPLINWRQWEPGVLEPWKLRRYRVASSLDSCLKYTRGRALVGCCTPQLSSATPIWEGKKSQRMAVMYQTRTQYLNISKPNEVQDLKSPVNPITTTTHVFFWSHRSTHMVAQSPRVQVAAAIVSSVSPLHTKHCQRGYCKSTYNQCHHRLYAAHYRTYITAPLLSSVVVDGTEVLEIPFSITRLQAAVMYRTSCSAKVVGLPPLTTSSTTCFPLDHSSQGML